MANWKLTLAYNGSGLHGWQIQPDLRTVQGILAEALRQISGETVLPQGAGRTDSGVHALAQVASVTLTSPIPPANLQRALNRILPGGIRVLCADLVSPTFHARHSARGKRYEYRIFERRHGSPGNATKAAERICSPFLAPFVWDCRWPLDLERMQAAAGHLLGTQDFTSMAASAGNDTDAEGSTAPLNCQPDGSAMRPGFPYFDRSAPASRPSKSAVSQPNPVKTIYSATWHREDNLLLFRIQGSGFLHHMVRNLVGTLVDVGRGSLTPDDLPRILSSRDRAQAGPTAPASGLYLVEVLYPQYADATEQQREHTEEVAQ